MARLQEQLKYFVHNKLSTDRLWQGVNVYLSGHEVRVFCVYALRLFSMIRWVFKYLPRDTFHRHQGKESTRLWSSFDQRMPNQDTIRTRDTAFTVWMLTWQVSRSTHQCGLCLRVYHHVRQNSLHLRLYEISFCPQQIMLGLTSHEPHFSLLREEVRFGGKKSQKRCVCEKGVVCLKRGEIIVLSKFVLYGVISYKSFFLIYIYSCLCVHVVFSNHTQ